MDKQNSNDKIRSNPEEMVGDFKKRVRSGQFDQELREEASTVLTLLGYVYGNIRNASSESWFKLKDNSFTKFQLMHGLVAEIFDRFGEYLKSRKVLSWVLPNSLDKKIEKYRDELELKPKKKLGLEGRLSLEEKREEDCFYQDVFLLQHQANLLYRDEKYSDCLRYLLLCEDVVIRWFGSKPTFLLCRIKYSLAICHRQLSDLSKSIEYSNEAVSEILNRFAYYQGIYEKGKNEGVDLEHERSVCAFNLGLATGLSLSWVYMHQGKLTEAKRYCDLALYLFSLTGSELIYSTYCKVIKAGIMLESTEDPDVLKECLLLLTSAEGVFSKFKNTRYYDRVQLAKANHFLKINRRNNSSNGGKGRSEGDLGEVSKILTGLTRIGESRNRISVDYFILLSQYRRQKGDLEGAYKEARNAYDNAKILNQSYCLNLANLNLLDILVTISEKELDKKPKLRQDPIKELKSLEEEKSLKENPRLQALCFLLLIKLYQNNSRFDQSQYYLNKLGDIQHLVENISVRQRRDELALMQSRVTVLELPVSKGNYNYNDNLEALREYILRKAEEKLNTNSKDALSGLLKISKQSIYNWEEAAKDRKNKA